MTSYEGSLNGSGMRIAIVCGRFNDLITERLLAGARELLLGHVDFLRHFLGERRRCGINEREREPAGQNVRRLHCPSHFS